MSKSGIEIALGIEEALEQQPEPDRVEIGDGERIGDERAGAGAAARSDRNALRLRPLDEIRDDEKVAGVFHAGDDAEFERKPFAIIFDAVARRQRMPRQPLFEPGEGGAAQFFRLVRLIRRFRLLRLIVPRPPGFAVLGAGGEARQDRRQRPRPKGAAFGDLNARRQRLRQIGEQRRHFRAALEAMLGGELAALAFGDELALGDA